jgi:hypothetical protein
MTTKVKLVVSLDMFEGAARDVQMVFDLRDYLNKHPDVRTCHVETINEAPYVDIGRYGDHVTADNGESIIVKKDDKWYFEDDDHPEHPLADWNEVERHFGMTIYEIEKLVDKSEWHT